jgi:hypothetical protein
MDLELQQESDNMILRQEIFEIDNLEFMETRQDKFNTMCPMLVMGIFSFIFPLLGLIYLFIYLGLNCIYKKNITISEKYCIRFICFAIIFNILISLIYII